MEDTLLWNYHQKTMIASRRAGGKLVLNTLAREASLSGTGQGPDALIRQMQV